MDIVEAARRAVEETPGEGRRRRFTLFPSRGLTVLA